MPTFLDCLFELSFSTPDCTARTVAMAEASVEMSTIEEPLLGHASAESGAKTTPTQRKRSAGPSPISRSSSLCKLNLTPAQISRRKALIKLAAASNSLGLFHHSEADEDLEHQVDLRISGRGECVGRACRCPRLLAQSRSLEPQCNGHELRIANAGVAVFAGASAVGYYLLRLVSRDLLGGFAWCVD